MLASPRPVQPLNASGKPEYTSEEPVQMALPSMMWKADIRTGFLRELSDCFDNAGTGCVIGLATHYST